MKSFRFDGRSRLLDVIPDILGTVDFQFHLVKEKF